MSNPIFTARTLSSHRERLIADSYREEATAPSLSHSKRVAHDSSRLALNGVDTWTAVDEVAGSTSAAQIVFGTYELLEPILLHLPAYNIIAIRAVARFWQDTVASSTPLKRAALLLTVKGAFPKVLIRELAAPKSLSVSPDTRGLLVNPLFRPEGCGDKPWTYSRLPVDYRKREDGIRVVLPVQHIKDLTESELAEWRSMYLMKPPCTSVCVKVRSKNGLGLAEGQMDIGDKFGITLGKVADTVLKEVNKGGHQSPAPTDDVMCISGFPGPGRRLSMTRVSFKPHEFNPSGEPLRLAEHGQGSN
ncbi:hypothetical protein LTR91_016668 [Friedmanniomyces endolithicus]|uniref:F-box domain-containing protein n=1 Tax=Friedmanniomyces endolithicus TaxID=329885 RepID=A0AAN6K7F8_9PEZI|nr:hypothetical protein LTR94_007697 [Friedmanniomyces endolithicus]KAK0791069.1 hypothetical protein LTR75_011877 [Friedmanniomyces endolithicus]KAK0800145.1 hypothetical protein LTR38_007287 [Friedmanniomyces endolithicus]KAK0810015.1 hypothetical protein LTR59_002417 [Friedmanniomyces endolithicus]KAK0844702.1 hypothetical protein LTR03_007867 [Friedmanniomyces endolithicus]